MKKVVFVLAAAGLMTLGACSKSTPADNAANVTVADNAGENLEDVAGGNSTENASNAQ
jgi:hypothetical protein